MPRGTGEPWEVCEQGRDRVNPGCRKNPLGPPVGVNRGQKKAGRGEGSRERGGGLSRDQAVGMEKREWDRRGRRE